MLCNLVNSSRRVGFFGSTHHVRFSLHKRCFRFQGTLLLKKPSENAINAVAQQKIDSLVTGKSIIAVVDKPRKIGLFVSEPFHPSSGDVSTLVLKNEKFSDCEQDTQEIPNLNLDDNEKFLSTSKIGKDIEGLSGCAVIAVSYFSSTH